MKSKLKAYYIVDLRDSNVRISQIKHDTSGGMIIAFNQISISGRRCGQKDLKLSDRILKCNDRQGVFELESLEAEILNVWGDTANVKILSSETIHRLELDIDRKERLTICASVRVVLDESERPRMLVYSDGKTFYCKTQALRENRSRTPEPRSKKDEKFNPFEALRSKLELKPSKKEASSLIIKEELKANERNPTNDRGRLRDNKTASEDQDGFKKVLGKSRTRKYSKGLNDESHCKYEDFAPSKDQNYKYIPCNHKDPSNTKFEISVLSKMHRDSKNQVEYLKEFHSNFRYFQYNNDSFYKVVGVGYLEFLFHRTTDSIHLHNFKQILNTLQLNEVKFQHRTIVLSLLDQFKEKLQRRGSLNFNKICSNSIFMVSFISLLRSLAGYQMKLDGVADFIIHSQTVKSEVANVKQFKHLPMILKASVVLHNIEAGKPFEHGHPNPIVSIHIIQKFNKDFEERNMELLYFKYLDDDYKGEYDIQKFKCHICAKLLHETAFPVNEHVCCCRCIALHVLQNKENCSVCKTKFRPKLISFIQLRDYECSKCLRICKFEDLKLYNKYDKLICNRCVKQTKNVRVQFQENQFPIYEPIAPLKASVVAQDSDESEPVYEHSLQDEPASPHLIDHEKSTKLHKCVLNHCTSDDQKVNLKCSHEFCRNCISRYFHEMNGSKIIPILCPVCKKPLGKKNILSFISSVDAEKYILNYSKLEMPCEECGEMNKFKELQKLECEHMFDHICLENHFKQVITRSSGLIKCPKGCPGEVNLEIISLLLNAFYIKKYLKQVEEIRKRVKCQLKPCEEILNEEEENAVHLNCSHSICRACAIYELISQIRSKQSELVCPICTTSLQEHEYSALIDAKLLSNFRKNKK